MPAPPPPPQPTAAELAVLQLLWARGPLAVKAVHEALVAADPAERPVVYTTVLKTMQVMHERGLLAREADGRRHIYRAAVQREATQDTLLDTFLTRAFGGSAKRLVMSALGNHQPTAAELAELRAYLDTLEPGVDPETATTTDTDTPQPSDR